MSQAQNPLLYLPQAMREALAVFTMLRRCRLDAKDIFVRPQPPPHNLQVILRKGPGFVVDCGPLHSDCGPLFQQAWCDAIETLQSASDAEIDAMLDTSHLFKRKTELAFALVRKGILPLPAPTEAAPET